MAINLNDKLEAAKRATRALAVFHYKMDRVVAKLMREDPAARDPRLYNQTVVEQLDKLVQEEDRAFDALRDAITKWANEDVQAAARAIAAAKAEVQ